MPPGALAWQLSGGVRVCSTGRREGDLRRGAPAVEERRRAVVALPWTTLRQVHGARVVTVTEPGGATGEEADAAVAATDGVAVAVMTGDCAPIAFASPEGVFGVAHAGWRGLRAGVIEATVAAMRDLGATEVAAVLGPCIGPDCYAFSPDDLATLVDRFGPSVRSEDRFGAPALDVPAAVRVALRRADATLRADAGVCTGCSDEHWSWRARRDRERQATVVWRS
jgi:YfiH family protein